MAIWDRVESFIWKIFVRSTSYSDSHPDEIGKRELHVIKKLEGAVPFEKKNSPSL
jgi:hypothetical protein